jgi:N-acetylglucosaminyldiphosphoundecaprenol N-acetyl-beta-D-mannosaminyltransferase
LGVPRTDDLERNVFCILGMPIDAVEMPEVLRRIKVAAAGSEAFVLSTPNLNFLVNSLSDSEFRESLLLSDLCPTDGMPIVWLARIMGIPIERRVAGSDIFEALKVTQESSPPLKIFIFGGAEGVAAAAADSLNERGGGLKCIGALYPGFGSLEEMSKSEIIERINASHADLLVASLGAKKGQLWLLRNHRRLRIPIRAHLGAIVNFQAGTVRRAPLRLRQLGLEWLWRIWEEPYLWTRYGFDGCIMLRVILTHVFPLKILNRWLLWKGRKRDLDITRIEDVEWVSLRLSGTATADQITYATSNFAGAVRTSKNIAINLSDICLVDARFLGLLLMLRKSVHGYGKSLKCFGAPPQLRRLFRLNAAEFLLSE